MWYNLRGKNFEGLKFRRKYPIGNYVVDFCCPLKKVVIELDGSGHMEKNQAKKDKIRGSYLKEQGFKVFRVSNSEVDNNMEGVLDDIFYLIDDNN